MQHYQGTFFVASLADSSAQRKPVWENGARTLSELLEDFQRQYKDEFEEAFDATDVDDVFQRWCSDGVDKDQLWSICHRLRQLAFETEHLGETAAEVRAPATGVQPQPGRLDTLAGILEFLACCTSGASRLQLSLEEAFE